jgi:hypothetical protein
MLIKTIETIYEVTLSMACAIKDGNYAEFEQLLTIRQDLMEKVDEYRANIPQYQYSPQEKIILEDILQIDQSLTPKLQERIDETRSILNQIRMTKQASKKYQPYMKQINGAFIDRKK